MIAIALTGSAGSGKSAVAKVWEGRGVPVVRADDLARAAVAPGSDGLHAVAGAFGREVLAPEGTLDRALLRRRVFRDPEARGRLEKILHPRIRALRDEWLADRREEGEGFVAAEIPLLFETGMEGEFDATVLVLAPKESCLERMVRRRGLAWEEASAIWKAQMDPGEKRRRADHVIDNDGTLEELREKALELLDLLRGADWAGEGV